MESSEEFDYVIRFVSVFPFELASLSLTIEGRSIELQLLEPMRRTKLQTQEKNDPSLPIDLTICKKSLRKKARARLAYLHLIKHWLPPIVTNFPPAETTRVSR
jgi:hypothetical protein